MKPPSLFFDPVFLWSYLIIPTLLQYTSLHTEYPLHFALDKSHSSYKHLVDLYKNNHICESLKEEL